MSQLPTNASPRGQGILVVMRSNCSSGIGPGGPDARTGSRTTGFLMGMGGVGSQDLTGLATGHLFSIVALPGTIWSRHSCRPVFGSYVTSTGTTWSVGSTSTH